jgi:hypothetical protein
MTHSRLFQSTWLRLLATFSVVLAMALVHLHANAGEADVLKAVATKTGDNYRFDVTIRSNDKGWDYYCDRFEIVSPDGKVLGTRILYHPHETEQPFTRSLGDVSIPASLKSVTVRASMKPSGEGGETVTIELPGR